MALFGSFRVSPIILRRCSSILRSPHHHRSIEEMISSASSHTTGRSLHAALLLLMQRRSDGSSKKDGDNEGHSLSASYYSPAQRGMSHASKHRNFSLSSSDIPERSSPQSSSSNTNTYYSNITHGSKILLRQLLIKHREKQRRLSRNVNPKSHTQHENLILTNKANNKACVSDAVHHHDDCGATWHQACALFSKSIQQHAVMPTAQHFNVLLRLTAQEQLWAQLDAVEAFYADMLHAVHDMASERDSNQEEDMNAHLEGGGSSLFHFGISSDSSSHEAARVCCDDGDDNNNNNNNNINNSAVCSVEGAKVIGAVLSALQPNAQTYHVLMRASLERGSWQACLSYLEDSCCIYGLPLCDARIRLALEAYLMGGARTRVTDDDAVEQKHGATASQDLVSSSLSITRLLANPVGGSQTFFTQSTNNNNNPSAMLWEIAFSLFTSCQHLVTDPRTVLPMARLLADAGAHKTALRMYSECAAQGQVLVALPSGLGLDADAAVGETLLITSRAACEEGGWRVALQIYHDAVKYVEKMSALFALYGRAICSVEQRTGSSHTSFFGRTAQQLLVNALHTLRRVGRYAEITAMYRLDISESSDRDDGGGGDIDSMHCLSSWRMWLWTPRAFTFVAQAALATQDVDLLLGMIDQQGSGDGIPVEAYDAALRLIQHKMQQATTTTTTTAPIPTVAEEERDWLALSQHVYGIYVDRAVKHLATSGASDLLTVVHEPLVRLLHAAMASPCSNRAEQTVRMARDSYLAVRQPDALLVALVMDIFYQVCRQPPRLDDVGDGRVMVEITEAIFSMFKQLAAAEDETSMRHLTKPSSPVAATILSAIAVYNAVRALLSSNRQLEVIRLLCSAVDNNWLSDSTINQLHREAVTQLARKEVAQTGSALVALSTVVSTCPRGNDWVYRQLDASSRKLFSLSLHAAALLQSSTTMTMTMGSPVNALEEVIKVLRVAPAIDCLGHSNRVMINTIITALIELIGRETMFRCTLWPQCLELIAILSSPLQPQQSSPTPLLLWAADVNLVSALHRFIDLCDGAEESFVERLILVWLVPSQRGTDDASVDYGRTSSSAASEASIKLLCGALVWACKREDKRLVRALKLRSNPFLSAALTSSLPPQHVVESEVAVLMCLSGGAHVDIANDWPVMRTSLERLLASAAGGGLTSHSLDYVHALLAGGRIPAILCRISVAFRQLLHVQNGDQPSAADTHASISTDTVRSFALELLSTCQDTFLSQFVEPLVFSNRISFANNNSNNKGTLAHLLVSALSDVVGVAWDLVYLIFTTASAPTHPRAPGELDQLLLARARRLLLWEVSFVGGGSSPDMGRHVRYWCLVCAAALGGHGGAVRAGVATLCADVTQLEAVQGTQKLMDLTGVHCMPVTTFLVQFLSSVDHITQDVVLNGSACLDATGLRILHETALRMLSAALWEGAACNYDGALLTACLSWACPESVYSTLLHVMTLSSHMTHFGAMVEEILLSMARIATWLVDCTDEDCHDKVPLTMPAGRLLVHYIINSQGGICVTEGIAAKAIAALACCCCPAASPPDSKVLGRLAVAHPSLIQRHFLSPSKGRSRLIQRYLDAFFTHVIDIHSTAEDPSPPPQLRRMAVMWLLVCYGTLFPAPVKLREAMGATELKEGGDERFVYLLTAGSHNSKQPRQSRPAPPQTHSPSRSHFKQRTTVDVKLVLKECLTKNAAWEILSLCFPDAVLADADRRQSSGDRSLHALGDDELSSLLSIAAGRVTPRVRDSIMSANTVVRRAQQRNQLRDGVQLPSSSAEVFLVSVARIVSQSIFSPHLASVPTYLLSRLSAELPFSTASWTAVRDHLAGSISENQSHGGSSGRISPTELHVIETFILEQMKELMSLTRRRNSISSSTSSSSKRDKTYVADDSLSMIQSLLLGLESCEAGRGLHWVILKVYPQCSRQEALAGGGGWSRAIHGWHTLVAGCVGYLVLFLFGAMRSEDDDALMKALGRPIVMFLRMAALDSSDLSLCVPTTTATTKQKTAMHALQDGNRILLDVFSSVTPHIIDGIIEHGTDMPVGGCSEVLDCTRAWLQAGVLIGAWKEMMHALKRFRQQHIVHTAIALALCIAILRRPLGAQMLPRDSLCITNRSNHHGSAEVLDMANVIGDIQKHLVRPCTESHASGQYLRRITESKPLHAISRVIAALPDGNDDHQCIACSLRAHMHDALHVFVPLESVVQLSAAVHVTDADVARTHNITRDSVLRALSSLSSASAAEYALFTKLESATNTVHRDSSVQTAWRHLQNALQLQEPSLIPDEALRRWFMNLQHVPHTRHFITLPLSEALMHSCNTVEEAVSVIQFSLSRLPGCCVTAVQYRMMTALLERARTSLFHAAPLGDSRQAQFRASLTAYTYTTLDNSSRRVQGLVALVYQLRSTLSSKLGDRVSCTDNASQHLHIEMLRCGVYDADLTRCLYLEYRARKYRRLDGVHAFLSCLCAARLTKCEDLATQAMLDYLSTSRATTSRNDKDCNHKLPAVKVKNGNRVVWKAFVNCCRSGAVCKDAAIRIVALYKEQGHISEVEELMVTILYP